MRQHCKCYRLCIRLTAVSYAKCGRDRADRLADYGLRQVWGAAWSGVH